MSFDELDFDLVVDLYEMAFESEGVELWIVVIHVKRRVKVDAGVENKRMWCSVCVEVGGKKFKKKKKKKKPRDSPIWRFCERRGSCWIALAIFIVQFQYRQTRLTIRTSISISIHQGN